MELIHRPKSLWRLRTLLAVCVAATWQPATAEVIPPRVIGAGELLIIPRPKPAVEEPAAEVQPGDNITPFLPKPELETLLVHPFYYTRDLEFQSKTIKSDRYLLIANHPHSGHRCAIKVVLPDGAPIIVHRRYSITYLYPSKRVIVDFGLFGRSRPKVVYKKGRGTLRDLHGRMAKTKNATRNFFVKLPITGALKENGQKVVDTAKGAAALGGKGGTVYLETVSKLLDGVPGVKTLEGLGQQLPELERQEEIKQAGAEAARNATQFIKTNR